MKTPSNWDQSAHAQWQAGQKPAAIQTVLAALNVKPVPIPYHLAMQLAYYTSMSGNWRVAASVLTEVCKVHTDALDPLLNLAICHSRAGDSEKAIETLKLVLSRNATIPVAWDSLASSCYRVGRYEEARQAGEQSLELKNSASKNVRGTWRPPAGLPSDFVRRRQTQNTIAFSLWGSNPRYLRGALQNAILVQDIYPGWRCRFYIDPSVPQALQDALSELGAELITEANERKLNDRQRLMRRFLVANDEEVAYFLVRDCDSVINQREAAAVAAWIKSDRWFHVMRDWWTHTDLMLAGMWGGVAGILPDMEKLSGDYESKLLETPHWDQWFLGDRVWPMLREDSLIHDRCFRALDSHPFPAPELEGNYHVGQDEFAARRAAQEEFLAPWLDRLPCLRLPSGSGTP